MNSSRQNSVEPSISFAPARYGSVGRDEGFDFPAKSWRTKLREQQIADNRKLIDSVRSRGNSASREINENFNNIYNNSRSNSNAVQGKVYDNTKHLQWLPVHEYAIKGQNDNDLHQKDRNNNLIISTKPSWGTRSCSGIVTSRRELSEPPLNNRITSTNLFPSNRYLSGLNQDPEPTKLNSTIRGKYDLESMKGPTLTLKDRKILAEAMTSYLGTQPPQFRYVPTQFSNFFFNIAIFCHFFFSILEILLDTIRQ